MKTKNFKKILGLIAMFALIAVIASACARTGANANGVIKPPTSGPYAFVFKYIGHPFQELIKFTARTIGGSNGFAFGVIIISFIVRLVLLPLGLNQATKSTTQQEKMKAVQPQLKLIQEKQKEATTPEAQSQISQLMMKVYRENNMSMMGGIGCLPLILQFPVMIGIYQAVQYSPEIGSSKFLGLPLGKSSIIIAIVAALVYVLQSYIAVQSMPVEQRQQSQAIMYMNPIITFFISMVSSAALGLYFLAGGIVMLIQQIITSYVLQPRIKKNIDKYLQDHPVKQVVTEESLDAIIKGSSATSTDYADDNSPENVTPTTDVHERARNKNKNLQQNKKD